MKDKIFKTGKIPNKILNELIFKSIDKNVKKEEVLIRPSIGEDCSVINIENEFCVLSSDPITAATEDIGYLAVIINVNDIASAGSLPIGIMVTILLPEGSTHSILKNIMDGINKGAKEVNIEVLGGHTEVTNAVVRPVVSITIIGKTINRKFLSTSNAKINDDIIITKHIGIEGTYIMLKELLKNDNNFKYDQKNLQKLSMDISVLKESVIAMEYGASAMHDITEGGVIGALYEISRCNDTGIIVNLDKIPVLEETIELCEKYNINPYKLISSGSMLITTSNGQELLKILLQNNIEANIIGKITKNNKKIYTKDNIEYEIKEVLTDEIYKFTI